DVDVVDELGLPVGRGELRVLHLRELEVRRRRFGPDTADGAAAVERPVPEAEGDHVGGPDGDRLEQKLSAASLVTADERGDHPEEKDGVGKADDREEGDRDGAAAA